MSYRFLVDTYQTERLKVLSVWSMFREADLAFRPHPRETRGRSVLEHLVHQCQSENAWFSNMLGIDVGAPPLPGRETLRAFMKRYAEDSRRRLRELRAKDQGWWEEVVPFFEARRSRAWILLRRIAHTAHHRGQQTALLRMLGRDLHSTYGPTADTGGLPANDAPTLYAYKSEEEMLQCGEKQPLPGPGDEPVTERPG